MHYKKAIQSDNLSKQEGIIFFTHSVLSQEPLNTVASQEPVVYASVSVFCMTSRFGTRTDLCLQIITSGVRALRTFVLVFNSKHDILTFI